MKPAETVTVMGRRFRVRELFDTTERQVFNVDQMPNEVLGHERVYLGTVVNDKLDALFRVQLSREGEAIQNGEEPFIASVMISAIESYI